MLLQPDNNDDEPYAIVVKNTFIQVQDCKTRLRSSSSVPPSLELSRIATPDARKVDSEEAVSTCSTSVSPAFSGVSTLSTRSKVSLSPISFCVPTDLNLKAPAWDPSVHFESHCEPCDQPLHNGYAQHRQQLRRQQLPDQQQQGQQWDMQQVPQQQHTSLRKVKSKARAWTPSTTGPNVSMAEQQRIVHEMMTVMAAVRGTVLGSGLVVGAEALQSTESISFTCWLNQEQMHHREQLIYLIKDTLLRSTEVSKQIFILGYLARPFVDMPLGFVSMLGAMQNEERACWDVFAQGFCWRKNQCRWQHAVGQHNLRVTLEQA